VAIANALQLEAGRRRADPIPFIFVSRAKFELAQPIRCRLRAFLLLIRYVTLWPWTLTPWPWPLTFDLEHNAVGGLHHGRTLYEIWAKSENPRRSYCSLNIWPYDLEHVPRVALCHGIVAQSLNSIKLSVHVIWWFFDDNTPYHAMTLPLTRWPWKTVVDLVSRGNSLW